MKFAYINIPDDEYIIGLCDFFFIDDIDRISKKINIDVELLKQKLNEYNAKEKRNFYYFNNKQQAISFIQEMNILLKLRGQ